MFEEETMGSDRKLLFKMTVVTIVLMIVTLTCSAKLTNPPAGSVDAAATFSALGTSMAGAQAGQAGAAGETPSIEPTAQTRPPVVHSMTPPEGATYTKWITDKSDLALASQHRANGGENFDLDIFERPFTSNVMDYLPDIDITQADFARSGDWVFVDLIMAGTDTAGGMKGVYGIEVDSNMNGRGDFIIFVVDPTGTTWSSVGVKAYEDTNKDVGGSTPLRADLFPGNGYDTLIFDEGYIGDPDAAWGRINPSNASAVQLAFKYTLIRNNDKYMWGAFAGLPEMLSPAWFDYNDHFTHAIAGSSLSELVNYYPLKSFYGWDNTCRWVVGIKYPTGNEPGLCPYTPLPTAGPTCIPGITHVGC
jgi:hypothetical protein